MKLATRYLPYGSLPYNDLKLATHMVARLYKDIPYLPIMPNLFGEQTLIRRAFENMPGVIFKDNEIKFRMVSDEYNNGIALLENAFNNPTLENLEHFSSEIGFLEKYLQIIKKFQSKHACINILGPFTVSQILLGEEDDEQLVTERSNRKVFIQTVCVKALLIIEKIKQYSPKTVPIVVLEEPMLGQFGLLRRSNEDVTVDIVINMFAKVIEKLKAAGALVCVQCFDKCDWSIPINAGVDMISFDAYNNPSNLSVIPELVTEFLQRGGVINWAIIPATSEEKIKELTVEYLAKRLFTTIEALFLDGVPLDLLYKNSTVSINCNMAKVPAMFVERIIMTLTHLADRLAAKL